MSGGEESSRKGTKSAKENAKKTEDGIAKKERKLAVFGLPPRVSDILLFFNPIDFLLCVFLCAPCAFAANFVVKPSPVEDFYCR